MGCSGFLLFALSSTLLFTLNSAYTHNWNHCNLNSGANYTANNTFEANLYLLLSSISLNANQFYINSVGRSPDRVYGLFQCRGDYNSQDCQGCARVASEAITDNCPYKKEAVIYYDECWLHYSWTSFVTTVQVEPTLYMWKLDNISDPNRLPPVLNELMDRLITQALYNSSNLFATGETNFNTSQKLYGMAQCTQDLLSSDCNTCLTGAVSEFPDCYDKRIGGSVVKPSCYVRYESFNFIQSTATTQAPAPPPPPALAPPHVITSPNTITTTGQGKKSSKNIVPIIVPTIVVALVLSAIIIFVCLRRKKGFELVNDKGLSEISTLESLQFNLATIAAATDNFSAANQLGEGDFGTVYKGKLSDRRLIVVKRLSRHSGQGVEEFKNEVMLLASLQHRNLVLPQEMIVLHDPWGLESSSLSLGLLFSGRRCYPMLSGSRIVVCGSV